MRIAQHFARKMAMSRQDFLDDADPLCFHRRPEETVAMFEERVCDELRVSDEYNARKYPVQVIIFQCNSERDGPQSGSPPGHSQPAKAH